MTTTVKQVAGELSELKDLYKEHDKILIRGNGVPSLQEEIRTIKKFIESLRFWMTAFALAFIGQFVAVGVTMVIIIIQALPYLKMIADQQVVLK